jgi:hypothetical protein
LLRQRALDVGGNMPERRRGDDGQPRTHLAERRFAIRGEAWSVWEDSRTVPGPSLVFENEKLARRVREYPRNWHELTDAELYALSWSR